MISGTIYGVVLNDLQERNRLAEKFDRAPYGSPPIAPVVYIKPRQSISCGAIAISAGSSVTIGATLAMLFARDAAQVTTQKAIDAVGAVALALDVSLPQENYYRPAVTESARDRSLVLGTFVPPFLPQSITTSVDGVVIHTWQLDRLVRPAAQLISELSSFMTLRAGDVLLVGLAGDAPVLTHSAEVQVSGEGLPNLTVKFEGTAA